MSGVRRCGPPWVAGRTRAAMRRGEPCLYAVMGQESAQAHLFVLRIDIRTGACQRFSSPPGVSDSRPCLWSERWQRLFIDASGLEHADRPDGGWLLWLDPKTGRIEMPGVLRPRATLHLMSIADAAGGALVNGRYYFGSLARLCSVRVADC